MPARTRSWWAWLTARHRNCRWSYFDDLGDEFKRGKAMFVRRSMIRGQAHSLTEVLAEDPPRREASGGRSRTERAPENNERSRQRCEGKVNSHGLNSTTASVRPLMESL